MWTSLAFHRTAVERGNGTVRSMPYEWEILLELPDTAEAVYDLEVKFKTEMQDYHYKPKISFNGSTTECYTELSEALQQLIQWKLRQPYLLL